MKKVKLKLKHLHWQLLAKDLWQTTQVAPLKGYEIETMVIGELYTSRLKFFEIWPNGKKEVTLTLSMVHAYAINTFLGAFSNEYNTFIRMDIEPKLIPGKTFDH